MAAAQLPDWDDLSVPSSALIMSLCREDLGIWTRSPDPAVCDVCSQMARAVRFASCCERLGQHALSARMIRSDFEEHAERAASKHDGQTIHVRIGFMDNVGLPNSPATAGRWCQMILVQSSAFLMHQMNGDSYHWYTYSARRGGRGVNEVVSLLLRYLKIPIRSYEGAKLVIFAERHSGYDHLSFVKFLLLLTHAGIFSHISYKITMKGHVTRPFDTIAARFKDSVAVNACWTLDHVGTVIEDMGAQSQVECMEYLTTPFSDVESVLVSAYEDGSDQLSAHEYQVYEVDRDDPGMITCKHCSSQPGVAVDARSARRGKRFGSLDALKALYGYGVDDALDPDLDLRQIEALQRHVLPMVPLVYWDDPLYIGAVDNELNRASAGFEGECSESGASV